MRELIFFTPKNLDNVGGGEKVLSIIANRLSRHFKIIIITPYRNASYFQYNNDVEIVSLNLQPAKTKYEKIQNFVNIPLLLSRFLRHRNYHRFVAFSLLGIFITSFCSIPRSRKLGWIHTSFYQPDIKLLKYLELKSLKSCGALIILNKLDSKLFSEYNPNIVTIPNPLTIKATQNSALINKRLISVGRYNKDKGFDYLIRICSKVLSNHMDWTLEVYGQDDGEKGKLEEMVRQNGMMNNIFLNGPQPDLLDKYRESSIFLFTSLFECFGLVLIEANEFGLPCVVFDSPSGIKDIIQDGYNGFMVKCRDENAFADCLEKLITDENLRFDMGRNAIENAKKYLIENIEKLWLDLLC